MKIYTVAASKPENPPYTVRVWNDGAVACNCRWSQIHSGPTAKPCRHISLVLGGYVEAEPEALVDDLTPEAERWPSETRPPEWAMQGTTEAEAERGDREATALGADPFSPTDPTIRELYLARRMERLARGRPAPVEEI